MGAWRYWTGIIGLLVVLAAPAPSPAAEADAAAIRQVVEAQLAAFQRDDGVAAFGYASPSIQEQFNNPDVFMEMVRTGYAPVYRPREVEFLAWPHGVPVWIDGLRDGQKLRPGEVRVAESGVAARTMPFLFPEVENLNGLFSPPRPLSRGVSLWLVPNPRRRGGPQAVDRQVREDLKSLGYLP